MKFAICDDDELFCVQLEKYIKEFFSKKKIKSPEIQIFHCGEDLLASEDTFDIAFLDVEMSGISGIHTGRELKKRNRRILFMIITSYTEYLDEALQFHAFRYLSKPLDKARLFRNLESALYVYQTENEKILIETKEENITVFTSSIVMIEIVGRKVYVRTTTEDYLSIHKLQYWMEHLNQAQFFQPHKSYIINFKHVTKFDKQLIYLFNERYKAYLTYRRYAAFKSAYLMYLDSTT